jgi:hypothetical protein
MLSTGFSLKGVSPGDGGRGHDGRWDSAFPGEAGRAFGPFAAASFVSILIVVLPITIVESGAILALVLGLIFFLSSQVPLVLPRSSIQKPPSSTVIRACRLETSPSSRPIWPSFLGRSLPMRRVDEFVWNLSTRPDGPVQMMSILSFTPVYIPIAGVSFCVFDAFSFI